MLVTSQLRRSAVTFFGVGRKRNKKRSLRHTMFRHCLGLTESIYQSSFLFGAARPFVSWSSESSLLPPFSTGFFFYFVLFLVFMKVLFNFLLPSIVCVAQIFRFRFIHTFSFFSFYLSLLIIILLLFPTNFSYLIPTSTLLIFSHPFVFFYAHQFPLSHSFSFSPSFPIFIYHPTFSLSPSFIITYFSHFLSSFPFLSMYSILHFLFTVLFSIHFHPSYLCIIRFSPSPIRESPRAYVSTLPSGTLLFLFLRQVENRRWCLRC